MIYEPSDDVAKRFGWAHHKCGGGAKKYFLFLLDGLPSRLCVQLDEMNFADSNLGQHLSLTP